MGLLGKRDKPGGERAPTPVSTTATKIRVIKFKEGDENYRFRLKTSTIDPSSTKYAAMTYAEEPVSRQASSNSINLTTVMIDGSPRQVGRALFDALEHLHDVGSDLPVWVDKLCIDHSNPIDGAMQTNLMGDIFGKATHLVAWLGRKPPYASDTIYTMRRLVNAIDWRSTPPETRYDFRDPRIYQHLGMGHISMQEWNNIFDLCNAPWFTRVWTFYELAGAKNAMFLYGDSRMDLKFMTDFAKVLELTGWADSQPLPNGDWSQAQQISLTRMFSLVTDFQSVPIWHPKNPEHVQWMQHEYGLSDEPQRAWKFLEFLIQTTDEFQCLDPRDKLFAPLALVRRGFRGRPVDREWPLVDYTAPVEGLYANFARLILKNTGVPSVLAQTLPPESTISMQTQETASGRQLPRRKPIDTM